MYSIVEFKEEDGGGLAVVQEAWLTPRKREVYWPPIKDQRLYNKLVKDSNIIPGSDWELYAISRSFYETDDYEKAQEKLKLAQVSSDLGSEAEFSEKPRRRIKRPVRYSTSDDGEENLGLKRPPLIEIPSSQIIGGNCSSHNSTPARNNCSIRGDTITKNKECTTPISSSKHVIASKAESMPLESNTTDLLSQAAFQRKLFSQLLLIQQQNEKILAAIKDKSDPNTNSTTLKLPIDLPISKEQDLVILEEFLQNKNNSQQFVQNISHCGGRDVSSLTYRILNKVLSDELAKSYNYFGKRSAKQAFSTLKLKTCIVEAVLTSIEGATEFGIEESIRAWLKHAPDRLKRKLKQAN